MLKAVIFDMDGTLLDSEVIHYIVIHEILLKRLGYDQSVEEYMGYCGVPDAKMWPAILRGLENRQQRMAAFYGTLSAGAGIPGLLGEEERISAASAELERLHWKEYDNYIEANGVKAFAGVRDLFRSLKDEGLKIGIATGSLHRVVDQNLERLGIREYVDAVAASEDCRNGKPAPDIYLTAAGFLGVDPGDCLVIEDARNGLIGAQRAGMACAGFDGSQLPSDVGLAPVVFSDYTEVGVEDLCRWHESQTG